MSTEKKSWLKDLLVAFAATTLSIILTFGTTGIINRVKQKQERKLTALMVMSSIEQFARDLEEGEKEVMPHLDSIATWLLSLPIEDVVKLGDEPLSSAFREVLNMPIIVHDQTAETIFSSCIDTWKTMGNFKFIDNVGTCFSLMNSVEEEYNKEIREFKAVRYAIDDHPSDYPGSSMAEKYLRNEQFRQKLSLPYTCSIFFPYYAEDLREANRYNMHLIGITEKEVLEFTDKRGAGDDYEEKQVSVFDFEKSHPDIDSLAMHLSYARQADSLLRVK